MTYGRKIMLVNAITSRVFGRVGTECQNNIL